MEWASCPFFRLLVADPVSTMGMLLWHGHVVVARACCCGTGMLLWHGHLARDNYFRAGCAKQAQRGGKSGQALWWCVTGLLATKLNMMARRAPNTPYFLTLRYLILNGMAFRPRYANANC
ncbi:MAG: hypothetical protein F6K38_19045 [Moorea sp. SIO3B2]|nr:hypothetical protein [Moorena sp. SIO3B2]